MQTDTTLASIGTGLPGYQPTPPLPAMPTPSPDASNATQTWMLTQVWQQGMATATRMAVMEANITAIRTQTEGIERDLGSRIKELEQARLTEITQMGGMRADLASQIAQAINQTRDIQAQQNQSHSANQAQWGSTLTAAAMSAGIALIGIIVSLLIVLSQHHP